MVSHSLSHPLHDEADSTCLVYFRPESVQLAIDILDETDFRMGQPVITGPMRVREADASFKSQKELPNKEQAKTKGTNAYRDRQKAIEKKQEMNRYVDRACHFLSTDC